MKFTIVVHSAPYSSQGAHTALRFCQALIDEGHEIYRLFFFRAGLSCAEAGLALFGILVLFSPFNSGLLLVTPASGTLDMGLRRSAPVLDRPAWPVSPGAAA